MNLGSSSARKKEKQERFNTGRYLGHGQSTSRALFDSFSSLRSDSDSSSCSSTGDETIFSIPSHGPFRSLATSVSSLVGSLREELEPELHTADEAWEFNMQMNIALNKRRRQLVHDPEAFAKFQAAVKARGAVTATSAMQLLYDEALRDAAVAHSYI